MSQHHLILLLDAPMMSFGSEAVDAHGVVCTFPALSAVTGLLGNALGWDRADALALNSLQERLVFGTALLDEGVTIKDFQTAKLAVDDRGWTTHGRPEGRTGSPATYRSPHVRYRYANAQVRALIALRLEPPDGVPSLEQLSQALDRPERPIFIGRKPFIPSGPILRGTVEAANLVEALALSIDAFGKTTAKAQWPLGEGSDQDSSVIERTDERDWASGVHAGLRRVREGVIVADGCRT